MRRTVVVATLALATVSGAQAQIDPVADPAPYNLQGSDTMRELSIAVIAAANAATPGSVNMEYIGGGSGTGGQGMITSKTQQVSPQSRFLSTAECNAFGANQGQGVKIALDGVVVMHDDTEGSACKTMRYAGCMDVQDLNNAAVLGFGNGVAGPDDGTGVAVPAQYCFTHWSDVLRIIYTGQTAHPDDSSATAACSLSPAAASAIANRRCNSDIRRTLVENWANMFDTANDDGAGGCADAHCTRLKHAFRRDDFSGTTDAFLSLISAPGVGGSFNVRTYCNGLENEDLDPIRRPCTAAANASNDQDSVCAPIPFANRNAPFGADGSPSGQSGNTAPSAPAANSVGDLGLVLPVSLPQDLAVQYDNNFCTASPFGGSFKYAPMPAALSLNAQKCPDGNARNAGQCRYPVYATGANAGKFNCKSRRTNRPGALAWANFDARAYNLTPRDPVTGAISQPNSNSILDPRWAGGGHYRIHMTAPLPADTGLPAYANVHPACARPDATNQIGCLVQSDPCSIGFAGREALDRDNPAEPDDLVSAGENLPFLLRAPLDANTAETTAGDDVEVDALGDTGIANIQLLVDEPGAACVAGTGNFDVRYPIARILWFSASKGFGGFPGAMSNITNTVIAKDGTTVLTTGENNLAQYYTTRANVDPLVDKFGFIRLPASYPEASRLRQCP